MGLDGNGKSDLSVHVYVDPHYRRIKDCVGIDVETLGRHVRQYLESCPDGSVNYSLVLKVNPEDMDRGVFGVLKRMARELPYCKDYKKVRREMSRRGYLNEEREVSFDNPFDFIGKALVYVQDKWGISWERFFKNENDQNVSKIRAVIIYGLKEAYNLGNVQIGNLFNKNSAVVTGAMKRLRGFEHPVSPLEDLLDEGIEYLGGFNYEKIRDCSESQ